MPPPRPFPDPWLVEKWEMEVRAGGEEGRQALELLRLLHLDSDHNEGGNGGDSGGHTDGVTGSGIPGDTPLHQAMCEGDVAELQLLLAAGADPNSANSVGVTPLYMASQRGLTAAVEALLAAGAAADCQTDEGCTPLMAAIHGKHVNCMQPLLTAGASLAVADGDGHTALHWAAGRGAAVLEVLLAAPGAAKALEHTDTGGRTTLLVFAGLGDAAGVAALCRAGADVAATDTAGAGPLHLATAAPEGCPEETIAQLLRAGADANAADNGNSAPLHGAAQNGNGPAARALLAGGARPNSRDSAGYTPLMYAVLYGHAEVAKALLAAGADPLLAGYEHGDTAMHLAARCGETALMDLMCRSSSPEAERALLGAQNSRGLTPLHFAAFRGQVAAVRWLLRAGADPAAADKEGDTPLHLAAHQADDMVVTSLLAHPGIHTSPGNQLGHTPLHLAAIHGKADAVGSLIMRGASLEAEDQDGDRPLHCAALGRCPEAVMFLLAAGADSGARNRRGGQTARDIAAEQGDGETLAAFGEDGEG